MAGKELFRPVGLDPSWSNDENLNDPGETWDATATKVEPGAGKRDDGFLPNEQPPAQHVNHLLNEIGKWLQFFSNVQIQNWDPPQGTRDPSHSCSGFALTRDMNLGGTAIIGRGVWMAAGASGIIVESRDGINWAAVSTAGSLFSWAASKDPRDPPVLATSHCSIFGGNSPAGNNTIVDYIGTTKSTRAVAGSTATTIINVGRWWGGSTVLSGLFVTGGGTGATGANTPLVWWNDPSSMSATWNAGTGLTKNDSTQIVDIAAGPISSGLIVAIGDKGTTHADVWTSTDGKAWSLTADVWTVDPLAVAYNEELDVWMCIVTGGLVYTSSNGTTWNLLATTGFDIVPRSLSGVGSVWACLDSASRAVLHSTDGGTTWRYQAVDCDIAIGALSTYSALVYAHDVGRWGFTMIGGAFPTPTDDGQFRQSLSAGTLLAKLSSGSLAVDTPTVT